jgi:hypothetical protein
MPLLVITAIAADIISPSVHANRFGRGDTQAGVERRVNTAATTPTGLCGSSTVTLARKSTLNSTDTACSGQ